ncbi:MAG: hypothetical protein WDO68_04000 [Gammaproteobacteria bacterium]
MFRSSLNRDRQFPFDFLAPPLRVRRANFLRGGVTTSMSTVTVRPKSPALKWFGAGATGFVIRRSQST